MLSASPVAVPLNVVPLGHSRGGTVVNNASPLPSSLTPAQVQTAYGFNLVSQNGAGQTIAIVDAYDDPNLARDLITFDNQFKIGSNPNDTSFLSKINENGGSSLPAANAGWATEISLDVEWAHAMAPGANIVLVEASSTSFADLFTAVDTASSKAQVVSMSWGSNEFSGESYYDSHFAGHTGVVYIASSGDSDTSSYPAASPYVLSVGGTSLYTTSTSGTYGSEKAWDYTGGGESLIPIGRRGHYVVGESEPGYQTSVQNTGVRITPDVAYNANPNTGFAVYDSLAYGGYSGWQQYGGTSAGAPQWAALVALVDQGRGAGNALDGPTQLLPTLYTLSSSNFHSPTTDDSGTLHFNGYNTYTGLGSPVANVLIPNLINNAVTKPLNTAPGSFAPGTIVTIHVVADSTPTTSDSTGLTPAPATTSSFRSNNFLGVALFFTGSPGSGGLATANLPPVQSPSNSGTPIFTSAASIIGTNPGLPGLPSHGPLWQLETVVDDPAANIMDPDQPKDDGQDMGFIHSDPLLLADPVFLAQPSGTNHVGSEGNYVVSDALFADWEWLDQRQNPDSASLQGDGQHSTGSAAALVAMALLTWPCGTSVVRAEAKKRKTLHS